MKHNRYDAVPFGLRTKLAPHNFGMVGKVLNDPLYLSLSVI